MGKVRFFCDCGKEIWDGLSENDKRHLTIEIAEATCMCADCLIAEERKEVWEQPVKPPPLEDQGYRILPGEEEEGAPK